MQPQNPEIARAIQLASSGQGDAAREIVVRLAEARDPEGLYVLADMHWRGALVARDWRKARALFAAAADAGNMEAGLITTNLLASGVAGERDWPRAIARLREEAERDSFRARALALVDAMELDAEGNPAKPPAGQLLLSSPHVQLFRGLFTLGECECLYRFIEPMFAPSMVADDNLGHVRDPVRTSDGAPYHEIIEDPATHALNRRLAAATESEVHCGETLLILRYLPGQEYRRHLDALPGLRNQRVKTALVYLNQNYMGGETQFVRTGLKFRGQPGDALVFRNTLADGRPDPMSEHAGLPVTHGVKYLASRWIRERPYIGPDGLTGS